MQRHLLGLTLVTAGFAGGALVGLLAQAPPQAGRGGPRGPQGQGLFQLFDTNGDMALSAGEIDAAPKVLVDRDQNRDGRVTLDELPIATRGGRGGRGEFPGGGFGGRDRGEEGGGPRPSAADDLVETLMAFDKNGDEKLTRDEVPERMQGIFDNADVDKNGQLTADEIRKSVSAQEQTIPDGGRGARGGGRGGPGGRAGGDAVRSALDLNADGVIDATEMANAPKALRALDRNGDGTLAADELMVGRGRGGGRVF